MKTLLIQPPGFNAVYCESPERFHGEAGFYPPLGLMYIAAYLEKISSHKPEILDAMVEKMNYEDIALRIRESAPDVVGISTTTFNLIDAYRTAQVAKKALPGTLVVMGGPHISIYPDETLSFPEVDIVVMGEGELAMKELLDGIEKRGALDDIKGIGYKKDGKKYFTQPRPFINDLDLLPFPSRELTPYRKYYSVFSADRASTVIMTSRGCPYGCTFCFHENDRRFRARSAKNVVDEIEECVRMGISEFFIFDETFTIDKKRVMDICEEITRRRLRINFDMRTRVDTISEELLRSLKKAGCKRVQYGVESGSQRILGLMKKGITLEGVRKAFRMTKEHGIDTYADFMLGFPTETKEEMEKTISFSIELNPDFVQFAITTLYPGTELYKMAFDKGLLKSEFWREFSAKPERKVEPPLWTEPYSRKELMEILEIAYSRFYARPAYVLKRLLKIRSLSEFIRHWRMGMKIIFKNNGRD